MNWFNKRANEASTWGGLGMLALGLGDIFKVAEAPAVAEAAGQGAQVVSAGGSWWQALAVTVAGGLLAIKSDGDKGF